MSRIITRVSVCLISLAPLFLGTIAASGPIAPLPSEEMAKRAIQAMQDNAAKYKDILYVAQEWEEFRSANGRVQFVTPRLNSHFAYLDKKAVEVLDGWDDQEPLETRYSLNRRIRQGKGFTTDYLAELLKKQRRLTFRGTLRDK